MRWPIIAIAVLAGCNDQPGDTSKIMVAREAVQALLRDPSSAEFRNERLSQVNGNEVVCGEFNAKNGFGGRNGFQRFISNGEAVAIESQMPDFEVAWTTSCPT